MILPRHLAESLSPDQLRLIFAHELAHVRRFDNLALLGQQLIEALFFFHPSTWLCRRGLRLEAEKACDDAVLHRFPDPTRYADSLAWVAELCGYRRQDRLLNTLAAAESRLSLNEEVFSKVFKVDDASSERGLIRVEDVIFD